MMTWLKTLFSGKPHFVIGSEDDPYMLRWYLIPRNKRFNLYLHKFLRDEVTGPCMIIRGGSSR